MGDSPPATSRASQRSRISLTSSGVKVIFNDPRFSSRYLILLVLFRIVIRKSCAQSRSPMANLPWNGNKVFTLGHDPGK